MKKSVVLLLLILSASSAFAGRGIILGAGYDGGAGILRLGFVLPRAPKPNIGLGIIGGYGLGKNYSLLLLQGEVCFKINPQQFYNLNIDYANYSEKVRNLPGIAGTINKGGVFGVGVAAGRNFGEVNAKIGYSSVLGLTFNIGRVI